MQLNQVTSVIASLVAERRVAAAEAAAGMGSAEREYGLALSEAFAGLSVQWFTIEHTAKGAEANLVHDEKAAYFKELHSRHPSGKYPNPSVPWARVRKYASDAYRESLKAAAAEAGEAVPTEAAEAAESTGARHRKSLSLRYVDDLTGLFKAGRRAEKDGTINERERQALIHITSALSAMGIDINTL
jgi:hypothetical protein